MGESWYLAADFQLFLFGPWFMMLIWSFEKIQLMLSVGFMAVLLATSCAIPGKFRLRFEFLVNYSLRFNLSNLTL